MSEIVKPKYTQKVHGVVAQGLGRWVIRGPIVKTYFFFYCAKKHKKFTILIILNVQYSGANYMHKVVQQISKPF